MVRKTFVEWCREFKTPKSDIEFWTMNYTGLHISDVSPRGTTEINYALERWNADMQRKISESMVLNSPTRM